MAKFPEVGAWGVIDGTVIDDRSLAVAFVAEHPEAEANAALIAAAPDLFWALEAVVNSSDYGGAGDNRPLMRDARAALARAGGEV